MLKVELNLCKDILFPYKYHQMILHYSWWCDKSLIFVLYTLLWGRTIPLRIKFDYCIHFCCWCLVKWPINAQSDRLTFVSLLHIFSNTQYFLSCSLWKGLCTLPALKGRQGMQLLLLRMYDKSCIRNDKIQLKLPAPSLSSSNQLFIIYLAIMGLF